MKRRMRSIVGFVVITAIVQLSPGSFAATDEETLRALHAKVMRAHRQSNVDLLLEDSARDFVVANRGEITRPTLEERRSRLAAYLGRTTFEEYRDVTEPIVTISADGSLGWVIVQVHARGVQVGANGEKEPLEFESAWIELYRKHAGKWYSVGNVSNFKP